MSWDLKLEDSTDFLLDIGCANPDDKTYKVLLSILMNLNDREFTPQECYDQIWKLKEKLVNKRADSKTAQTLKTFPADVSEFIKLFPRVYQECDPPVASQLDEKRIRKLCRKDLMPTRNSNNNAKKSPNPRGSSSSGNTDSSNNVDLLKVCMSYMMGGHPSCPQLGGHHRATPQKRVRALCDAPPDDAEVVEPSPKAFTDCVKAPEHGSPKPAGVSSILDQARNAMAARKNKADSAKTNG